MSKRAKDLTESTKMDIDIRNKEAYINKQYASMGKKYFEMHENDEEPLFEEIGLIREAKEEIQRMRDLLVEKKGLKKCSACQELIPQNVQFCPKCGAKCEMPAPEEAPAPQEDVKRCPSCQAELLPDALFCPECGAKYEAPVTEAAAEEVQEASATEGQTEGMSATEGQSEEA